MSSIPHTQSPANAPTITSAPAPANANAGGAAPPRRLDPVMLQLDYADQPTLGGVICHRAPDGGVSIRVLPSRGRKLRSAVQHAVICSAAMVIPFSVILALWRQWMRSGGAPWWAVAALLSLSGIGLVWSSLAFANSFFPVFLRAGADGLSVIKGRGWLSRRLEWPAAHVEDVYMVRAAPAEGGGVHVQLRTRSGFVHALVEARSDEAAFIAHRLRDSLRCATETGTAAGGAATIGPAVRADAVHCT